MGMYKREHVPAGLHLLAPGGSEARLLAIARNAEDAMQARRHAAFSG